MSQHPGRMFRSVFLVSAFTVLTGALNYLVVMVLAARFGAGREMDAFFAASTLPQLITAILLAALITTFIPVYIEARADDESNAWKLASVSINAIFVALAFFSLIAALWSKGLMSLINPGFSRETLAIASPLFQIIIVSSVFSGTSIVLTSIYYAHKSYLAPCLAQGLNSLVILLFVVFAGGTLGIRSVAFGTLLGAFVQLLFLLPIFLRDGRYSFSLDVRRPEIVRLGSLMLPLLAGSVFYRANPVVERFIASKLGESNISYLGYAFKVITLLLLGLTQGLSTTLLPRMSEHSAAGEVEGLKDVISKGFRAMILIAVPVTLALLLARVEIVRLIFERGDFGPRSTDAVARALVAYLGYFAVGLLSIPIVNALYSLQKTALVAAVGVGGFLFYVIMAFALSSRFSYAGIALAASLQYVVTMIVFFLILRKQVGALAPRPILACLGKAALASALAALAFALARGAVHRWLAPPLDFVAPGAAAVAFYGLLLVLLKTDELRFISLRTG